MYVCIILTLVFNLHSLLSFIYMVVAVHLGCKEVSVYWSMSQVNLLLVGKENLITTVALCLLGHHISKALDVLRYRELTRSSAFNGAYLVID